MTLHRLPDSGPSSPLRVPHLLELLNCDVDAVIDAENGNGGKLSRQTDGHFEIYCE